MPGEAQQVQQDVNLANTDDLTFNQPSNNANIKINSQLQSSENKEKDVDKLSASDLYARYEEDINNNGDGGVYLIALLSRAGVGREEAKDFIDANYSSFAKEINAYGFRLDNPFIKFLSYVYKKRNAIFHELLDPNNYNIIHNAVVHNVLDVRQIAFESEEIDQPKLLLNLSFYNKIPNMDKEWLLQVWEWCSDDYVEDYILNDGIKLIFLDSLTNDEVKELVSMSSDDKNKTIWKKINFNTPSNIQILRKLIIFTPNLEEIANSLISSYQQASSTKKFNSFINDVRNVRNKAESDINVFPSLTVLTSAQITSNIHSLAQNVQLSSRDASSGQYQKYGNKITDGDRSNNIRNISSTNFNNSNRRISKVDTDNARRKLVRTGVLTDETVNNLTRSISRGNLETKNDIATFVKGIIDNSPDNH